jgi:hypothetical protein
MSARAAVMAKAGRPSKGRDDVTVKIDRALAGKLKHLAIHRGLSVAEVLSELVRVPVDRAYAQMLRELEHGKGGDG